MSEPLDRDSVISLLDRLGSADDADVLEAAHELHAQINAANVDWDDLLTPMTSAVSADADHTDASDATAPEGRQSAPAASGNGKDADTLALIENLLANPDRSEALREELEEYKADIANGEFQARDHQYVRSLYERLRK